MNFDKTIPNDAGDDNNNFMDSESGFNEPTFDGIKGGLGVVDRYVLKEKLGAGGFGSVYLAEDTEAKILVALKVLPSIMSDIPEEMEKVRDNFALVSQLSHSNIAGLKHLHKIQKIDFKANHALGVSTGGYLVVMEYVAGSTLSSWKKAQGGKIPFEQAVDICSKVAEALDYAHGRKIIHRDIKPSNIMVTFDQTGAVKDIKVLDFGLAAEIRSSMSRVSKEQGDTSGTRPYMAPEQWSGGKQGFATDQYSLAVMFYELVSGEVPFHSAFETGDMALMMNIAKNEKPNPITELDKKKNIALLKGLNKKPEERYASCGDFVRALSGKKISHKGTKTQRKSGKNLGIVAAVCIAGIVAFGGYKYYQNDIEKKVQVQLPKQLDERIENVEKTNALSIPPGKLTNTQKQETVVTESVIGTDKTTEQNIIKSSSTPGISSSSIVQKKSVTGNTSISVDQKQPKQSAATDASVTPTDQKNNVTAKTNNGEKSLSDKHHSSRMADRIKAKLAAKRLESELLKEQQDNTTTTEELVDWPSVTLSGTIGLSKSGAAIFDKNNIINVGETYKGMKLIDVTKDKKSGVILEFQGQTRFLASGQSL